MLFLKRISGRDNDKNLYIGHVVKLLATNSGRWDFFGHSVSPASVNNNYYITHPTKFIVGANTNRQQRDIK